MVLKKHTEPDFKVLLKDIKLVKRNEGEENKLQTMFIFKKEGGKVTANKLLTR